MVKTIPEPVLGPESTKVLDRLKARGHDISWEIDSDLQGTAACDFVGQKIIFRDEAASQDEGGILHELLHMDLYDRGYPIISSTVGNRFGLTMLNDVFQHTAMSQELRDAGFSFDDVEIPGAQRMIAALTTKTIPLVEDEDLFSAALYMRGNFLELDEAQMLPLEEYILANNRRLTLDKVKEAITKLPNSNSTLEEYEKSIDDVLVVLGLEGEVKFERSSDV